MKINFKQQGGAMPPYLSYRPYSPAGNSAVTQQTTTQTTQSTSDKTKDDGKIKDKDLAAMIKEADLLPNDEVKVISQLKNMYELMELSGNNTFGMMSLYLNILQKAKQGKFSRTQYDNSYIEAKEDKGLNEIAITSEGKFVSLKKDRRGLESVSPTEYFKNPEKYRLVTNSNLLYLRAYNPDFASQDSIFGVVENAIGMEKVQSLIKSNLESLGTNESTYSINIHQENGQVVEGAEVLKQLQKNGFPGETSIDGLYQAKIINKNQQTQAKLAISYLYQMLPDNAKVLLKYKARGSDKGVFDLISSLVLSKSNFTSDISLDYKGAYDKDGIDKNSETYSKKSESEPKVSPSAQFIMGLGQTDMFQIQDGTREGLLVQSTTMPLQKDGKNMGRSTLLEVTSSDLNGALYTNNITMGGVQIDPSALNDVMVDGNVYRIDMVIDTQAAMNGIIKPDFRALKKKEQADKEIKDLGIDPKNYSEINKVYQKHGLPWKYNSQGKLNTQQYATFAVFDGIASSKAFDEDEMEKAEWDNYLQPLGENATKNAIDEFKLRNSNFTFDTGSLFRDGDRMLKGTVYIPIKKNALNYMSTSMTGKQATFYHDLSVERQYSQNKKLQNYHNPNNEQ